MAARCPRLKDTTATAFKPSSILVQGHFEGGIFGPGGGVRGERLANQWRTKIKIAAEADSIRVLAFEGIF